MLNLIIKAIEANADELQEALNEATGPVSIESAVEVPGALVIWTGALSHDAWEIRDIATGEGIPNGTMEFKAERRGLADSGRRPEPTTRTNLTKPPLLRWRGLGGLNMAGHIVIFGENCDAFHVSGRLGRWHTYQAAKAEAMERKAEGFYIFRGLGRLPTAAEVEAAEPFHIGGKDGL